MFCQMSKDAPIEIPLNTFRWQLEFDYAGGHLMSDRIFGFDLQEGFAATITMNMDGVLEQVSTVDRRVATWIHIS